MEVSVHFYSYSKKLAGCAQSRESPPASATLNALHGQLARRFPKLGTMTKSTLIAVGVDYQPRDYGLQEGGEGRSFRRCKEGE